MLRLAALVLSGALLSLPASAQSAAPSAAPQGAVGSTIDGGLPEKTTTAVGQTKPPGAAAPGTTPELEEKSRALDKRINQGICTGCK